MSYKYAETAKKALELATGNGGRFPSERTLCKICGVSRITAKKALNVLKEKGLADRQVGRGSFVPPGAPSPKISFFLVRATSSDEMREYFEREAKLFFGDAGASVVEFKSVPENVVSELGADRRTKIVYWPYIGCLSHLGAFTPLDGMPGFYDVCERIESSHCEWQKGLDGKARCYALPLHFGTDVFAFNRRLAKRLGLDADSGPQDWGEILDWARVCSKDGRTAPTKDQSLFRHSLPNSYYLTASKGRDFLEDGPAGPRFDFSAGAGWLSFFKELHSIQGNFSMSAPDADPILRGKTLFTCEAGLWILSQSKGSRLEGDIKTRPIPPMEKGGASFSRIWRHCVGLGAGGDEGSSLLAWSFIRHLLCDAGAQRRLVESFSSIAANKTVLGEQSSIHEWSPFIAAFHSGLAFSSHPARFGVNALIRKCYSECVNGPADPASAAAKAQEFGGLLMDIERERTWS